MNSQNFEIAAEALLGKELKNGWKVTKKLERKLGSSGGYFSVCYLVEKDGYEAFLKALNFKAFFELSPGKKAIDIIQEQTAAYKFEVDLLQRCKNNKLSKVSLILDEGEASFENEGFAIPYVPYLIFEKAGDDLRGFINFTKHIETAWKLKSLHNVAIGIKQLHSVNIAHQDLKPSNVLLYEDNLVSKIGDLGRSLCKDILAPHDRGGNFTGDNSYAPPEFLYGYSNPDWEERVKSTDLYLFGSMIIYYFIGVSMTSLLSKNIEESFRWYIWTGSFVDVKDYLINGYYKSLKEFEVALDDKELSRELIQIITYCCHPIPELRGHPTNIRIAKNQELRGNKLNQYDFQRLISKLDILAKKAQLKFVK
ncbi:protein kinase family protein [Aequorivita sublithincola DSM 14238]|uniref:Protein kinase family protein n=1 Tax=Aequorivita sublithincola (strain DSM 14238 / LMG 21431 / ACAM 643 / 9-3) TaxID=746697 RepID=I3YZY7_AEQSU|nr:protein kinase [Aequorivita sublithincola]AFL82555.1 protein kinase family protein [Aequorivita sublithincola DSM 14238]